MAPRPTSFSSGSKTSSSSNPASRSPPPSKNTFNYLLQITLYPTHSPPQIYRIVSVPSIATFSQLHSIICLAFSWSATYSYRFDVFNVEPDPMDPTFTCTQTLSTVFTSTRSDMIQPVAEGRKTDVLDAMRDADGSRIHPPESTRICEFFQKKDFLAGNKNLEYVYAPENDCWRHSVEVVGAVPVQPGALSSWVVAGEGHPAAEDGGGNDGWGQVKQDFITGQTDSQRCRWYMESCVNGDDQGLAGGRLWEWDRDKVDAALREFRWESDIGGGGEDMSVDVPDV